MREEIKRLANFLKSAIWPSFITEDSRDLKKGDAYITHSENSAFLDKAILNGAHYIISDYIAYKKGLSVPNFFKIIELNNAKLNNSFSTNSNSGLNQYNLKTDQLDINNKTLFILPENYSIKSFLPQLLKIYYNLDKITIMAITGTNGKTSITGFVAQMLTTLGYKAAAYGTLGLQVFPPLKVENDLDSKVSLTTPDICSLYRIIFNLYSNYGIDHFIFEASSHGLHQGRIEGLALKIGGISNLGHDHLDYHKTLENYKKSKGLLVTHYLNQQSIMILNADDSSYSYFRQLCDNRGISHFDYGKNSSYFRLVDNNFIKEKSIMDITVNYQDKEYSFSWQSAAYFQVCNILCAMSYLLVLAIPLNKIIQAASKVKAIPGRFEKIENNLGIITYIDYAHNPDAMEKVLLELKNHYINYKITLVFGCGGDRDKLKRPIMGKLAAKYANNIVITSDNPRNEDPEIINIEIIKGLEEEIAKMPITAPTVAKPLFFSLINRREAIRKAVELALQDHSLLLIIGKGHEKFQILANGSHYFSDKEEVEKIFFSFNDVSFKDIS